MGTYIGFSKGGKDFRHELAWHKWSATRDFLALMTSLPIEEPPNKPRGWDCYLLGEDHRWRPTDFPAWREAVAKLECNVEIFTEMLDLVEADPELWFDVSY